MTRRTPARSLEELLAGATSRVPMTQADSKSAASLERVEIEGASYVLKLVDGRVDWLAIGSGDLTARAVCLWEDGVYDDLPSDIDATVVGAARLGGEKPWPAALLMHDVSAAMVPEDAAVSEPDHAAFIAAMALLATHWAGQPPRTQYMPMDGAFRALSLAEATRQQAAGTAGEVQSFIEPGWSAVRGQRPELHALVAPLLADWSPLVSALQQLPSYFQHGDWKMGNLGRHPDGRVVLLDWDRPYLGPPTGDLAWYLAVNCDRLPESKEDTIARHREALRRCGADVSGWYDDALTLSLLGAFLQLGWSKAGQPEELDWWSAPVEQGVRMLGLPT